MAIKIEKYATPEEMEYNVTLTTDRDQVKFIKRIETVVRTSMEYRDYINFLKDYVNMKHCAFFNNIENSQGSKVRIEIHHEPLTLFDIVQTVLNKHLDEGIPINDLFIADEVMELHYKNQVGLIPLSKSVHQIVHNGTDIIIPLNMVYGEYAKFIEEYNDYLDESVVSKLERKINETKTINTEKIAGKLTPQYVYVEVDGFTFPQKVEIERQERLLA